MAPILLGLAQSVRAQACGVSVVPQRPLRPCARPGCPNLTTGYYCPIHQQQAEERRKRQQQHYDRFVRDKQAAAFYRSPEWLALREAVLARDHGLCQRCLQEGRITPADTVHHIVELREDWSRRLDPANLVSLCTACHNAVHGRKGRSTPGGSKNSRPSVS